MKLSIIPIGNSKGIRIPASVLNQCNIESKVDMLVKNGRIILIPVKKHARQSWDKKFGKMAKNNDDKLIIDNNIDLDSGEWEW